MIDTQIIAFTVMGEASVCGFMGMLAAYYVCQRSICYGWQEPNDMAKMVARWGWLFRDPTDGAEHLVSKQDLKQARVRAFTSDIGPPKATFECKGGLALYAY